MFNLKNLHERGKLLIQKKHEKLTQFSQFSSIHAPNSYHPEYSMNDDLKHEANFQVDKKK
jgi:hypothetical protein